MGEDGRTLVSPTLAHGSSTCRVVVGVDGTAANWSAVAWAVAEARRLGCGLLLVASGLADTAATTPHVGDAERQDLRRLTNDLLEEVRLRVGSQVRDVATLAAQGEPSRALVGAAAPGDLLVVGKRGGHPVLHTVLGSTSTAVAGHCRGPVVVVPDNWAVADHASEPVVAGVDDDRDPHVLATAFGRAERSGVDVVVVSAWTPPAPLDRSAQDAPRWRADAHRRLEAIVEPWRERYPTVTVRTRSHPLTPTVALLGLATDAQLLVVGRHKEPAHPGGLRVGSTTRTVLHHIHCPVLVVPSGSRGS
jgi:nucleotide-binding universal stress UspA family protein